MIHTDPRKQLKTLYSAARPVVGDVTFKEPLHTYRTCNVHVHDDVIVFFFKNAFLYLHRDDRRKVHFETHF